MLVYQRLLRQLNLKQMYLWTCVDVDDIQATLETYWHLQELVNEQ